MDSRYREHMEKYSLGNIFILGNRFQALLDRQLKEMGLTAKQWFALEVIREVFSEPPTLNQVAEVLGSSRQNVKELVRKLEARGYIATGPDPRDRRMLRLTLTGASQELQEERRLLDRMFLNQVFECFSDEEMHCLFEGLERLSEFVQAGESGGK